MAIISGLRVHSQAETRRSEEFIDQHGRVWWATVEQKTGDPVGNIQPSGWVNPNMPKGVWYRSRLRPPAKYLKILRGADDRDTKRRGLRLFIDYENWLNDWDEAEAENEKQMTEAIRADAKQKGLSMSEIEQMVKHPPAEFHRAFPPRSSAQWPRQLIVAMLRGNRWALGIPHQTTGEPMAIPPWAEPILDEWLKRQPIGTRSQRAVDTEAYEDVVDEDMTPPEPFTALVNDEWTPEAEPVVPKKSHKKKVPTGVK